MAQFRNVFPPFVLFEERDLSTFLPHLQHIQSILLLYLHHGPPQLYPLVEVLENLFLDGSDILFFVDSSARRADSIAAN
jgi:hypothetical protein